MSNYDPFNPAIILIHRNSAKDLDDVMYDILDRLFIPGHNVSYDRVKRVIWIGDSIEFHFVSGDCKRCAVGRRFFTFFNSDDVECIKYLRFRLPHSGNGEILDIYQFCDGLVKVMKNRGDGDERTRKKNDGE